MKKAGLIAVILLITTTSQAQEYKTAVGIRISSQDAAVNNSIVLKHFFNQSIAVEGQLSFGDPVTLGALLQKHEPLGINIINWFWSAGAYLGFGGSRNLGLQGGLGLDYKVPSLPLNFSIDWKPELNLVNYFAFEPAAVGISARFVLR